MVVVRDWAPHMSISLWVSFLTDPDWHLYPLDNSDEASVFLRWPPEKDAEPWRVESKASLTLTNDVKQISDDVALGEHKMVLTQELRSKLIHPTVFDPLSWGPADTLIWLSEQDHSDLVADLPDQEEFNSWSSDLQHNDAGYVAKLVGWDENLDVRKDKGWVTIMPRYPSIATHKVDRQKLEALLAALEGKDDHSFDLLCELACECETRGYTPFEYSLLRMLYPALGRSGPLGLYGSLDARDRKLVRSKGGAGFFQLSERAQQAIQSAFMDKVFDDDSITEQMGALREEVAQDSFRGKEPFLEFPDGLPAGTRIQLIDRSGPGVSRQFYPFSDYYTIPEFVADERQRGSGGQTAESLAGGLLAAGFLHHLILRLMPDDKSYIDADIKALIPKTPDFVPYRQLSEEVRKAIEAERKKKGGS